MENPYGLPDDVFRSLQPLSSGAPSGHVSTVDRGCQSPCCNRVDPYWSSHTRYQDDCAIDFYERSENPDAVAYREQRALERAERAVMDAAWLAMGGSWGYSRNNLDAYKRFERNWRSAGRVS